MQVLDSKHELSNQLELDFIICLYEIKVVLEEARKVALIGVFKHEVCVKLFINTNTEDFHNVRVITEHQDMLLVVAHL